MSKPLKPLYPYFGNKRRAAEEVWSALGQVDRYIEPFFGSGAVLLGNPNPPKSELINDLDHHVANLWRALKHNPEEVWELTKTPQSEVELKARHLWLKNWKPYNFDDINAYDAQAAGFWLWSMNVSIGMGSPRLRRNGKPAGVKGRTFTREQLNEVVDRIQRIEILCGDWKRCLTKATMFPDGFKSTGIFLDPPYGVGVGVPYEDQTGTVAREVWDWAVANGNNPRLRIVVAGYEDGRVLPEGWTAIERVEHGGHGNRSKGKNQNHTLERLWLSPYCLRPKADE
jgi:DNA adenine methylase